MRSSLYQTLRETLKKWGENKTAQLGAALAFYTLFSIAPLLVIAIAIAGLAFGERAARGMVAEQLRGQIGEDSARTIQDVIERVRDRGAGIRATVIALIVHLIGALTVFVQLRRALDRIWSLGPRKRGLIRFFYERLLAVIMVLSFGLLLLALLTASTALGVVFQFVGDPLPGGAWLWRIGDFIVSTGLVLLLVAAVFKLMSEGRIAWGDIWGGAIITAVLFTVGKMAIGYYLAYSTVASAYGAAGALVVFMIWVYVSAQSLLFGAEWAGVRARQRLANQPFGGGSQNQATA